MGIDGQPQAAAPFAITLRAAGRAG